MAEVLITHFREFDEEQIAEFEERARQAVGFVVYDKLPNELEQSDITTKTQPVELEGSDSWSPSGTEVNILCAAEIWPRNWLGRPKGYNAAIRVGDGISVATGRLLLGGLYPSSRKKVPVWTDIKPATGWYGPDTEAELESGKLTIPRKYRRMGYRIPTERSS